MRFTIFLITMTAFGQALPETIQTSALRMTFQVAPLSQKGTLDQQVARAVEAIRKQNGGNQVVKLRAFTAGADPQSIIASVRRQFSKRHLAPPVLNVIPVGKLLAPGAELALEAISQSKVVENPNGVAFISGQATQGAFDPAQPKPPMAQFAEKSIASLKAAAAGLEIDAMSMLRVTCFNTSLEDVNRVQAMLASTFPKAALNIVQVQAKPTGHVVECEGVARAHSPITGGVKVINPTNSVFAQAAIVADEHVILSSTFASTAADDANLRRSFDQLKKAVEGADSSLSKVFYVYAYPASAAVLARYRDLRWEFLDRKNAPASTNLVFEGPASPAWSLDVMALPGK